MSMIDDNYDNFKIKIYTEKTLQVEIYFRVATVSDAIINIIDGCVILWTIHWPNKDTILPIILYLIRQKPAMSTWCSMGTTVTASKVEHAFSELVNLAVENTK